MEYAVTTFYKFMPLQAEALPALKNALQEKAKTLHVIGLLLLAPEGVNATLAGSAAELRQYKDFLQATFGELFFKNSVSEITPFKRFKVKIKEEIVQLKRTDVVPTGNDKHVSPQAWDALIEKDDTVLIDVRNWYEAKLGTFKNAIDPKTKHFSEFPDWLKDSGITKDKKIAIFCTGGIRCEKAAVAVKEQGYEHVYQLDGGILNYIEQRPNKNFEGECFVFDHRTAVGQDLLPSKKYRLCANCGNGGALTKTCVQCSKDYRTCDDCVTKTSALLCSKNCRHQYSKQLEKTNA